MILELFNYLACILTIWGTWEVSKAKPNTLKVNQLYFLGSGILICIFTLQQNYPMIIMYGILILFAIRGMNNSLKQQGRDIREKVMGIFSPPNPEQLSKEYEEYKYHYHQEHSIIKKVAPNPFGEPQCKLSYGLDNHPKP